MYCPKCGTQNIEDARFCRGCGADIALVPQAMSGTLPEPRAVGHDAQDKPYDDWDMRRHRRRRERREQPRLDKAVSSLFTGVAFLIVAFAALRFAPGGRVWWFWLLIPAFTTLGGGLAEYVRFKQSRGEEVKLPGGRPQSSLPPQPARVSAIPPRNTSELVTPPPSVTEGTTRHLDQAREAMPRRARVADEELREKS